MSDPLPASPDAPATLSAYLVIAYSGSYDMRTSWSVALCPNEEQAQQIVHDAQSVADQIFADAKGDQIELTDNAHDLNPFDPRMQFVGGDPIYYSSHLVPALQSLPDIASALKSAHNEFLLRCANLDLDA